MSRRGLILLALETDPAVLQLLMVIAGPLGLEMVAVPDVRQAITELERRRPIALTLDVAYPEPDGFLLLEHIARHSHLAEVPTLVLSAVSDPTSIRRAYRLGVADYIVRPFEYDVVAPRLRMLLRLARDASETRERRSATGSEPVAPSPPTPPRSSEGSTTGGTTGSTTGSTTGRIQLQLAEAVRAARSFAHQIRNPLTAISAAAQLLGRDGIPATMRSNLATTIEAQSQRITDMLSEYIEQRQSPGRRGTRIDVGALVHEALDASLRATPTRQRVMLDEAAPLPSVGGDPARLGRMLRALIARALHATAADGTVTLAMRAENEGVLIDLRHPGRDDPAGQLPQPLGEEASQAAGGADLELQLVRHLVEEYGGRLEFEQMPEQGARLSLWLPGLREAR
jgi:signal transduction histidine kinase